MKRILIALVLATCATAADDLWTAKVQPLLAARCIECHGPQKAKHKLRLDTIEGILKGGSELGPAVIAGKPDESPLVKVCVMKPDEEMAMPPKGERLTAAEIAVLKEWITAGAK